MTAASSTTLPTDEELEEKLNWAPSPPEIPELAELAGQLTAVGRKTAALKVADIAVESATGQHDPGLRVQALLARARVQKEQGEHAAAVRSLLEAQSFNLDAGDAQQEMLIVSALGVAYGKLGIRNEAIAAHETALALAAQCAPELVCECHGNLGLTLANCERFDEAVDRLKQALAVAQRGTDLTHTLRARINLNAVRASAAELQLKRGETDAARAELREILGECETVLADCRAAKAHQLIPPVIQHIGIVHKCLGDADIARARFAYVTAMARQHGWQRLEFDALLHLGVMESDAGDLDAAEESLTRALGYFESAHYKTSALEAHLELARVHEKKGEFERAYAAMKNHHRIRFEMSGHEERMLMQVRAWREESYGRHREARQARQEAAARLDPSAVVAVRQRSYVRHARYDPLTGLANRRHGDSYFAQQFKLHGATNRVLAVGMVDIDGLEAINDRYSNFVGDMVLRQMGVLLRAACRDSDLAIRFGGDEFLLVFPNTTAGQAQAICERLCTRIDRHDWRQPIPGHAVSVTVVVADSRGTHSPLDLLRAVDGMLYEAKAARRSRVA
ncbi:MAG: diguanylate cyclase [Betaproteobacteria bacterium]|nr:diguanylate cyclase [Betaproteobacteria bacterium]